MLQTIQNLPASPLQLPAANESEPRPSEAEQRLEVLNALLANPAFKTSERNKRFLKFVVEETVAGRADRIKAFTIAVDVFGRDSSFDASLDPIVRIAAGQLRKSLGEFYEGPGRHEPIQITMPLGAYVPRFERRRPPLARFLGKVAEHEMPAVWPLAALVIFVAAFSAFTTLMLASLPTVQNWKTGAAPILIVDNAVVDTSGNDLASLARRLTDALWFKMGRTGNVRVIGLRPGENADAVIARSEQNFDAGGNLYRLVTSLQRAESELVVYWHLLDAKSGEAYHSAVLREPIESLQFGSFAERVATQIAFALFGDRDEPTAEPNKPPVLARYQIN